MNIVFTIEAKRDLDDLRAFLAPLSPPGLANVVTAIEARILSLADAPGTGRPTQRADVREAVEVKYGVVIPYTVREGTLFVLRIYQARRRPLDYAAIELP